MNAHQDHDVYQLYRRRALLTIMALVIIVGGVVGISGIMVQQSMIAIGASLSTVVACGLLFFIAWKWPSTTALVSYAAMVFITVLTGVAVVLDPASAHEFAPSIFLPTVLALIIGNTGWVVGTGLATLLFPLLALPTGPYSGVTRLPILLMLIGGLAVGRFLLETVIKGMRAADAETQRQSAHLQAQTTMLEEQNTALQTQSTELSRLLEVVSTLEVPILSLREGILMLPLVGHIDSRRMATARERLLYAVSHERARLAIIDVAGVALVDTVVLRELINTISALRLLGADAVISGISAAVATSVMNLGVDISQINTVRNIEEALDTFVR